MLYTSIEDKDANPKTLSAAKEETIEYAYLADFYVKKLNLLETIYFS